MPIMNKNTLTTFNGFEALGPGWNKPVDKEPTEQTEQPPISTARQYQGSVLYVSTSLKYFLVSDTEEEPNIYGRDVGFTGEVSSLEQEGTKTPYRQLDPEYFAWLLFLKGSLDRKTPRPVGFDVLDEDWGYIMGWAATRFGTNVLYKAVNQMGLADFVLKYIPPK